jgi:hypothetical protein
MGGKNAPRNLCGDKIIERPQSADKNKLVNVGQGEP